MASEPLTAEHDEMGPEEKAYNRGWAAGNATRFRPVRLSKRSRPRLKGKRQKARHWRRISPMAPCPVRPWQQSTASRR